MQGLDKLFGVLDSIEEDKESALERYRQLRSELAKGSLPTKKEIAAILEAAGKTPAELKSDVETAAKRDQLRASLAACKQARERMAELNEKLTAIDAEMEAFRRQCDERKMPFVSEISDISYQLNFEIDHRHQLDRTCWPEYREKLDDFRHRLNYYGQMARDRSRPEQAADAEMKMEKLTREHAEFAQWAAQQ